MRLSRGLTRLRRAVQRHGRRLALHVLFAFRFWVYERLLHPTWLATRVPRRRTAIGLLALASTLLIWFLVWQLPKRELDPWRHRLEARDALAAEDNVRRTIIQAIGGAFLFLGLYFTWQNVVIAREGKITDRFSKAIDQLGCKELEVRLGGIYGLERIDRDSKKDHWTIVEVLCAFVREKTRSPHPDETNPPWPTTDVQAALSVLRRRPWRRHEQGALDLSRSHLDRVELSDVHLERASLRFSSFVYASLEGAHLDRADLVGARLLRTKLEHAHLDGAHLESAHMGGADLMGARLDRATLQGARLESAVFAHAHLEGASLRDAHIEGASFGLAHMRRAYLGGASGKGARLDRADLREAILGGTHLEGADFSESHMERSSLESTQLKGANFYRTHLESACLARADLESAWMVEANLDGADLARANLEGADLAGANLQRAIGLTPEQIAVARHAEHALLPPEIAADLGRRRPESQTKKGACEGAPGESPGTDEAS